MVMHALAMIFFLEKEKAPSPAVPASSSSSLAFRCHYYSMHMFLIIINLVRHDGSTPTRTGTYR